MKGANDGVSSEKQQRASPKLKDDETIINPFYMKQLLQHAIQCAREGKLDKSDEELHQHACVSPQIPTRPKGVNVKVRVAESCARTASHRIKLVIPPIKFTSLHHRLGQTRIGRYRSKYSQCIYETLMSIILCTICIHVRSIFVLVPSSYANSSSRTHFP